MSGLLEGLEDYDLENASDDPFELKDGTYDGYVTGFEKVDGERQDGSTYTGLSVVLTPDDGVPYRHYLSFPNKSDRTDVVEIKKSKIKGFFVGCGVPASRLNTVTADDIVGTAVTFVKKTSKPNKNGKSYSNVEIRVRNDSDSTGMDSVKKDSVDVSDFDL